MEKYKHYDYNKGPMKSADSYWYDTGTGWLIFYTISNFPSTVPKK